MTRGLIVPWLTNRPGPARRGVTLRRLTLLTALCGACWLCGFAWFLTVTERQGPTALPHTDGIVALTGGAGRVELALRLLAGGQADQLLLSGIGGGTDLATLGRLAGIETAKLADRVTLGRYAASTRGNGVETAAWVEQNHISSLIVVTAAFHMPRALTELRQALPGVRLFPVAVRPGADKGPGWRLQAAEYMKYLLTVSGLSTWFPKREPVAALRAPARVHG